MRRRRVILGLVALTVAAAPGFAGPAAASRPAQDGADGQIIDFELEPPDDPLEAGDSITWTNTGDRPHTVTDRGGTFDTGEIQPGAQAEVTFDVPGTYEIFCQINPNTMNATVVVESGPEPPPAVRVQAFDENREGESRRFDPDSLEVESGTEIILANVGGLPHSLAIEGAEVATPVLQPGAGQGRFVGTNESFVVDEAGAFEFFCEVFPDEMRGTLVVRRDERPPEENYEAPTTAAGDDDDGDDGDEAAAGPDRGGGEDPDGTAFAYVIAVLVVGTGLAGLVLGLRKG